MKLQYLLAAISLLAASSVHAQQSEQTSINIYVPGGTPCVATGGTNTPSTNGRSTGNNILFLENYTDKILPNPAYITGTMIWVDGVNPIPAATYGNLGFAIDPGMKWTTIAGFPDLQHRAIFGLKPIAHMQLLPQGQQFVKERIWPPMSYSTGDVMIVAPECESGATPLPVFETYLNINFLAPLIEPRVLFKVDDAYPSSGNPTAHLRSMIPGPSTAATKVRVKIQSNWAQTSTVKMDHMVIGLQSGTGPDMQATPVVLTFNGLPAPTLLNKAGWIWSDWVPLNIPAGQNLIVGASIFSRTSGNVWDIAMPPSGFGAWHSFTVDSWNSATMQGSDIGFHAQWTHVIGQVQVQ